MTKRPTPINRRRFTVELLLDVVAMDAGEAERIGRDAARVVMGKEIGHLHSVVVSDVREDDEAGDGGGADTSGDSELRPRGPRAPRPRGLLQDGGGA